VVIRFIMRRLGQMLKEILIGYGHVAPPIELCLSMGAVHRHWRGWNGWRKTELQR